MCSCASCHRFRNLHCAEDASFSKAELFRPSALLPSAAAPASLHQREAVVRERHLLDDFLIAGTASDWDPGTAERPRFALVGLLSRRRIPFGSALAAGTVGDRRWMVSCGPSALSALSSDAPGPSIPQIVP